MVNEKKNKNLIILGVVIVLFVVGIFLANKNNTSSAKAITPAEAKTKTESFIKSVLLTDGTKFTLSEPVKYNDGLYQIDVTIDGQKEPIKSFLTIDGKTFIPSSMDIEKVTKEAEAAKAGTDGKDAVAGDKTPATVAPKSDKPKVEVFVMSHCPFGTQIEKGILPVAKALGNKIDFKIKFVSYAMHGEKELKEQLNQYCIQKEQPTKIIGYVECFVKSASGDSAACLASNKIDTKKMEACYNATDKQFKVLETFAKGESAWGSQFPPFNIDKTDNEKYGVQGSPTLVVNGKEISAGRDSASLAKVICDAFNKKPAECDKKFDSASPSSGFGGGTAAAGSTDSANCATN